MDMMEVWHGAAMAQPHPVTLSGGLVHFQTDMDGLMQITGSGNITVAGKNLIDDSKRRTDATVIYLGSTTSNYTIYLKAGTYRFTADMKNGADYNMYYRKSGEGAKQIWSEGSGTTSATFTLSSDGMYRFNFYKDSGVRANDVGDCCLSVADDTGYAAYTGSTAPAGTARKSLIGINNVWSDSGNITVTYWTH